MLGELDSCVVAANLRVSSTLIVFVHETTGNVRHVLLWRDCADVVVFRGDVDSIGDVSDITSDVG